MVKPSAILFWLLHFSCQKIAEPAPLACDLQTGEILITEIFPDPMHDETEPEWFEIYNPTNKQLVLSRMNIEVGTHKHEIVGDFVIDPNTHLVLGSKKADYVRYDFGNDLPLPNSQATITLRCKDVVVDTAAYGSENLPVTAGYSLQREINHPSWCVSEPVLYDEINFGTPALENSPCGIDACRDADKTTRGLVSLKPNDVVLSEVFADPKGADKDFEWIEIYVRSTLSVDLNGLTLKQRNNKGSERIFTLASSDCLNVEPQTFVVLPIGGNDRFALKGDSLFNEDTTFELWKNNILLDSIFVPSMPSGYAANIDNDWLTEKITEPRTVCKATSVLNEEIVGTPKIANSVCSKPCKINPKPQAGDINIVEIFADPKGADDYHDWLTIDVKGEFDLAGLTLVNTNAKGNQRIWKIETPACSVWHGRVTLAGEKVEAAQKILLKGVSTSLLYNEPATLAIMLDDKEITSVSYPKPIEDTLYIVK